MLKVINYPLELYHYGIKGQRWGVRRFQNEDGTYTAEGRKRKGLSSEQKEKLKVGIGAGVGVATLTVGAVVLAAKKPETIQALGRSLGKMGAKSVKELGEASKRAGKAAFDAAITTAGAIAITKLGKRLESSSDDEDVKKVIRDSTNAASSTFNVNGAGNNYQQRKGGPISRDEGARISAVVGPPRQKDIDRTGPEYQALFKDRNGNTRSDEVRAMIKSMASAGYGIDQIQKYLDSFAHMAWIGENYVASIM